MECRVATSACGVDALPDDVEAGGGALGGSGPDRIGFGAARVGAGACPRGVAASGRTSTDSVPGLGGGVAGPTRELGGDAGGPQSGFAVVWRAGVEQLGRGVGCSAALGSGRPRFGEGDGCGGFHVGAVAGDRPAAWLGDTGCGAQPWIRLGHSCGGALEGGSLADGCGCACHWILDGGPQPRAALDERRTPRGGKLGVLSGG